MGDISLCDPPFTLIFIHGQRRWHLQNWISLKGEKEREREVVCGQVWWPILGICPLHLTHPSAHSQQWTHTRSSGQPYCGARGAVGGSVPCSRVSPQSWYWRWREHLLFTPPTDNPCRTWESNLQPLGYKSNSLTIGPRLPPNDDLRRWLLMEKPYTYIQTWVWTHSERIGLYLSYLYRRDWLICGLIWCKRLIYFSVISPSCEHLCGSLCVWSQRTPITIMTY